MIDPNTLSRFAFLADLPAGRLADMAAASRVLSLEPSTVIFRSGDEADTLYGVIEGEVELSLEALEKNLEGYSSVMLEIRQDLNRRQRMQRTRHSK